MKTSALPWICLLALWQPLLAAPAPPSDLTVTDVSPKAFRAVWHSDPETVPEIQVFSNAAGTIPVGGLVLTPFPLAVGNDLLRIESSGRGLLSIDVSGLAPDTTYYFRARSRSLIDDSSTAGSLQAVKTARQAGLVKNAAPFAAFANPVVRFKGVTEDGAEADVSSLILASVPGVRSPVTAAVDVGPSVWLDLNNLISDSTGTALPVSGSEPLTLRIMRGRGRVETFHFFAPAGDASAAASDPQLTPTPLTAAVVRAHSRGTGAARVFMEFPVTPGAYYDVEFSETLAPSGWTVADSRLRSDNGRLFWEDNGFSGTPAPPKDTPKRFYRIVPFSP